MAHGCRAFLLFCMDYRLHRQLHEFMAAEGLDEDGADVVRIAGAAKNLARPSVPGHRSFVIEQLDTSYRLHGVRQAYLINHEDCGAYGPEEIPDKADELATHRRDLLAARDLLAEAYPGLEVKPFFMWLDGRCEPVG